MEQFKSWDEVLEFEKNELIFYLNEHKNIANISDFIENYNALIDYIDGNTEDYTEWDEVAEDFTCSSEEWRNKIEEKCRPIIEHWFEWFCENCKRNNTYDDYKDYIDQFFN